MRQNALPSKLVLRCIYARALFACCFSALFCAHILDGSFPGECVGPRGQELHMHSHATTRSSSLCPCSSHSRSLFSTKYRRTTEWTEASLALPPTIPRACLVDLLLLHAVKPKVSHSPTRSRVKQCCSNLKHGSVRSSTWFCTVVAAAEPVRV